MNYMPGEEQKRHRRIPPVVHPLGRTILGIELEDRQQLHCGYTQLLEIRNFLDQPRIRSTSLLCDTGTGITGEPSYVHFVNDRSSRRSLERMISFPIVGIRIHHYALHGTIAALLGARCGKTAIALGDGNGTAIRIQQDLAESNLNPRSGSEAPCTR